MKIAIYILTGIFIYGLTNSKGEKYSVSDLIMTSIFWPMIIVMGLGMALGKKLTKSK